MSSFEQVTVALIDEGRFVTDLGVPEVRWEAAAFAYYQPGGLRKMTTAELDGFTNDWVDPKGAYHMIRARAMYLLHRNLRDSQAADEWLSMWLEQRAALEEETEQRTAGALTIQGTILGDTVGSWL